MVAQPTTELVGKMYLNLAGLELLRKLGGFMLFIFVKFFFCSDPGVTSAFFHLLSGRVSSAREQVPKIPLFPDAEVRLRGQCR